MGDKNITLGAAGVSAILLFIGVWSNSWWSGSMMGTEFRFGLREASICNMSACVEVAYNSAGRAGGGAVFRMFGTMTFILGMIAAIGTVVAAFFHVFHGLDRFRNIAGPACLSMIPLSLITLLSFPGPEGMGVGWAVGATLLGAVAGAYASYRSGSGSWDVGTYKPVRIGPQTDDNGLAPIPAVDATGMAPIPGGGEAPVTAPPATVQDLASSGPGGGGGAAAVGIGVAVEGNAAFARPLFGEEAAAPAQAPTQESPQSPQVDPAAVTTAKLSFMARRIELSGVGISAMLASGGQRDLLWDDIRRISARALPGAPPYNGAVFVDVLPLPLLGRPSAPVRITRSCSVEIEPGTEGESAADVLRRIGNLASDKKPGIIEPASEAFFLAGGTPQPLTDEAALAAYDEQFGGSSYGR